MIWVIILFVLCGSLVGLVGFVEWSNRQLMKVNQMLIEANRSLLESNIKLLMSNRELRRNADGQH